MLKDEGDIILRANSNIDLEVFIGNYGAIGIEG